MKTDLLSLNNNTTELIPPTEAEVRQNAKKSSIPNDINKAYKQDRIKGILKEE